MTETSKFKHGDRVVYTPFGCSDLSEPCCEHGAVSSINEKYVFVKFDPKFLRVRYNGTEDVTSQACRPEDLITEDELRFLNNL